MNSISGWYGNSGCSDGISQITIYTYSGCEVESNVNFDPGSEVFNVMPMGNTTIHFKKELFHLSLEAPEVIISFTY